MSTDERTAAEAAEDTSSKEGKFFGITTSIDDMLPEKEEPFIDEEVIVERDDDAEEDSLATPQKPALKVNAGASDDDVEKYSDKVQKRIDKLTWERNEEIRQRKEIASERDEAFRVAKHLHSQSQAQADIIGRGEARLVDEIKNRSRLSMDAASARYRKAYEDGDTDAIIEAQKEMITAQHNQQAAQDYDSEYQQRVQNWAAQQQRRPQQTYAPQPQPQPQPRPQEPKRPTRESLSWAARNSWFGKNEHRDMTAIAYATHETMVRDKGIKPDSDEYYAELDATMAKRFPEYFGERTSKPHAVVASANRSGAKSRTVRLKPSERSVAKALGLTDQQYARQLYKEQTSG